MPCCYTFYVEINLTMYTVRFFTDIVNYDDVKFYIFRNGKILTTIVSVHSLTTISLLNLDP